jgi:hypothetical protein
MKTNKCKIHPEVRKIKGGRKKQRKRKGGREKNINQCGEERRGGRGGVTWIWREPIRDRVKLLIANNREMVKSYSMRWSENCRVRWRTMSA